MDGRVAPLHALAPAPEDIVLIHYSAYAPRVRRVLELDCRKLLLSTTSRRRSGCGRTSR